jgi:predicted pyridoxine 5'-phosphate oxidase superfamily flavin-nucleotide-binding protein
MTDADYGAVPEQAVVFEVTAWDVNCPQHITRRFSESEVAGIIAPLERRIAELEAD